MISHKKFTSSFIHKSKHWNSIIRIPRIVFLINLLFSLEASIDYFNFNALTELNPTNEQSKSFIMFEIHTKSIKNFATLTFNNAV